MMQDLRRPAATKRTATEANFVVHGAVRSARKAEPSSRGGCTNTVSAFSAALRIVLENRDVGRWFESVQDLQCVCFRTCEDCRESVPVRLHVSGDTPEHLWKRGTSTGSPAAAGMVMVSPCGSSVESSGNSCFDSDSDLDTDVSADSGSDHRSSDLYSHLYSALSSASGGDSDGSSGGAWSLPFAWKRPGPSGKTGPVPDPSRCFGSPLRSRDVPPPRIVSMVWERCTLAGASFGPDLAEITFGAAVIEPLQGVAWTSGLKSMTLTSNWNLPPPPAHGWDGDGDYGTNWPPLLEELILGRDFDQPVDRVTWPSSLRRLTFGERFNHRIDGVEWPSGLRRLTFGAAFNQSIEGIAWPPFLQELTLGGSFDQPVCAVTWPPRLKRLVLGARFNQDLGTLPATLEHLVLGYSFNNRSVVGAAAWPPALRELTFGHDFDVDISGVAWPPALEVITFGFAFDRQIDGVMWPASLRQLSFGGCFNQALGGVLWPATLRRLSFGFAFVQRVQREAWPAGLTHLSVDRWYPFSRRGLPSGVHVELM